MEKSSISSNSIFCFINVNTKKACFYKSMVMERICLAVLCSSLNSKFYVKKLHIYHQKIFLMVYHLTSALPTVLLSKNWQLPDSWKDLFASKSFSSGNVPLYSAWSFHKGEQCTQRLRFCVGEQRVTGRGEVWMRSRFFNHRRSQINFSKEYMET